MIRSNGYNDDILWNGRRKWDSDALTVLIPATGEVKGKANAALEAYRRFANVYYEIFNNGCFNWPNYGSTYRALCKAYGVEAYDVSTLRTCVRCGINLERLEVLGDLIIDAALEEQTNPLRAVNITKLVAA